MFNQCTCLGDLNRFCLRLRRSAAEIARDAVASQGATVLLSGATARTALVSVGGCIFFGAYEAATAFLQSRPSWVHG